MTKVEKDDLIAALRLRYDFYSAQTIFDAALARAELRDQDLYSEVELNAFREALSRVGDRLTAVEERIESLIETPAAPEPVAMKAEPVAKPEPVAAKPEPEPKPAESAVATISLVGVELDPGEDILVCGSFVDWNPDRAIAMTRNGEGWQVEVPAGRDIAFKFMRKRADGTLLWEPGDDRKLVGNRIDATWRTR